MVAKVKQTYPVEVSWLPFFLRPDTPLEGRPLAESIRQKRHLYGERLKERARQYGMEFVHSDWEYSSRPALEASEYAREQGRHESFHQIVFRKYFGEGQVLSDWEMLRQAALEAGLDPDDMQQQTESRKYKSVVEGHYYQSHSLGIYSIPTHLVGGRYAVIGAQPFEVFQMAMEKLGVDPVPDSAL